MCYDNDLIVQNKSRVGGKENIFDPGLYALSSNLSEGNISKKVRIEYADSYSIIIKFVKEELIYRQGKLILSYS